MYGQRINLKKPHPYSLERASQAFSPFESLLFIGDSMADLMMVSELRKRDPRFSFGGIYSQSGSESFVLNSFLDSRCDVVLPTVNELPVVLERVRGEPS
jgi:phosphoglycolate phosphatase-like HAD superfamily hydrolase